MASMMGNATSKLYRALLGTNRSAIDNRRGTMKVATAATGAHRPRNDRACSLSEAETMPGPADFCVSETLRTGLAVTVRALKPGDREKVERAVRELDRESIYTRLFTYRTQLTEAGLERIMRFDPDTEVVLLVTIGQGVLETVIGSGRYVVLPAEGSVRSAEIAFVVEEDYHGQGVAGRLLRHLAAVARAQGIARFEATVLPKNKAMLAVFERSGLPMEKRIADGEVHVALAL